MTKEELKDGRKRLMITKGLFTSDKDYWETPQSLFDELDAEFHFNLDPCCTHENAKCKDHYTIEEDGLKQKWGGEEFSAIPRMARKSANGWRSAIRKPIPELNWLSC